MTTRMSTLAALQFMLSRAIPKYLKMIMDDPERQVTMVTLEMLGKMLQSVGRPIIQIEGMLDSILICIKNVLQHRVSLSIIVAMFADTHTNCKDILKRLFVIRRQVVKIIFDVCSQIRREIAKVFLDINFVCKYTEQAHNMSIA